MQELQQIVHCLTAQPDARGALATLVTVAGSSYRRPGARLLWLLDGTRLGSVSGGCLEEDLLERLARVASSGEPELATYDTTSENDLVWGVGLGCHGVIQILLEPISGCPAWATAVAVASAARRSLELFVRFQPEGGHGLGTTMERDGGQAFRQTVPPPLALAIFGAGDDALPLAKLAQQLGWRVIVADPRPAYIAAEGFAVAAERVCAPIEDLAARTPLDDRTVVVIMTHRYVYDRPLLRQLLPRPIPYLGLLGPRARAERLMSELAADDFPITAEMRARLHAPVGLDLGADGAEQVALAIVAEIQAVLNGRAGQPLRHRTQPIHASR